MSLQVRLLMDDFNLFVLTVFLIYKMHEVLNSLFEGRERNS